MQFRNLIVIAQPGDEILCCSHLLLREPEQTRVLCIADGAIVNERALQRSEADTPEEFADLRHNQWFCAVTELPFPIDRVAALGLAEQEVLTKGAEVIDTILDVIRAERPSTVYTHAYEGGHPDADAVCYAVHQAIGCLQEAGEVSPSLLEFTGYHARDGLFRSAEFLSPYPSAQRARLTEEETTRKTAALRCFHSRYDLVARFRLGDEAWRKPDRYDFEKPPHEGALYYELARSGVTWKEFQAFVAATERDSPCAR